MQKNRSQIGSAHVVIIIVAVIGLLGAVGFIFWNNFLKKESTTSQTASKSTKPKAQKPCSDEENEKAENGTFCSKEIGIKFVVPSIFFNKLAKADNSEVFQGLLDPNAKKSAGFTENVYKATISGSDNFTFTITQEPLRSGYVGVAHGLQEVYYDQSTSELTLVKTPNRHYDSKTDTITVSGDYVKGDIVPSFLVGKTRFFKGVYGDAGQVGNDYFAVINNKIVKILLKNVGYMGPPASDPTTIDANKIFDELDKSIKELKIIQ